MLKAQRTRNLFDPKSDKPYKLSRTRLENFIRCPRCFYLDRRLGIDRPSMPGFTLNIAVDALLNKKCTRYTSNPAKNKVRSSSGGSPSKVQNPKCRPEIRLLRPEF